MMSPTFSRNGLRWLLPLLPGLATLGLLFVVLFANERIIERELAQRAQFRVAQYANVFADQLSRALSKSVSELEFTGRVLQLSPDDSTAQVSELKYLLAQYRAYAWVGWVDTQGRLLASASHRPGFDPGQQVLDAAQAGEATPQVLVSRQVSGQQKFEELNALGVLVVPVGPNGAASQGALVAALDRDYFERMRQFALGDLASRRSLDLTLVASDQSVLLGTQSSKGDVVRATTHLRDVDNPIELDWAVLSTQPRSAATSPSARFQDRLVYWGLPAALLIGLLGVWTSRRLARPYRAVLDAATSSARSAEEAAVPGAFLRALSEAMKNLSPIWNSDRSTQAFLNHVVRDAQQLQQVLDRLPSPVYLLDRAKRVTFWNGQAEAMFEWSSAEALGQPIDQLLPGQVHSFEAGLSPDGEVQMFVARTTTRRGLECWGEWHLLPLLGPQDDPEGQIVVVRDITDRVHAAERLARHREELAELTQRLMQQEQETTSRLAQTLHDRLGQSLSAIRLMFDALRPIWSVAPQARDKERAQRLDQVIDQAVAEVRQALVALRPPLLEELGLAAALDNECSTRQLEMLPARLTFTVGRSLEQVRWPTEVERAFFMIAREAVVNAARHAQAGHIHVRVTGSPAELTLTVEDDGLGMALDDDVHHPGHLGLVGMRERALSVSARLLLEPVEPHGLRVVLQWPGRGTLSLHSTSDS